MAPAQQGDRHDSRAPVMAALMAIAGLAMLPLGTPAAWLGAALLSAALVSLLQSHRQRIQAAMEALQRPRKARLGRIVPASLALETGYVLVIIALACAMLWDAFSGERPVSHDHTVHYFKALHMHRHLLPRGEVMGWNPDMFAGYPAGYLYPVGADLWVNLCHALSFGLLSFSQAYGVGFVAFFALFGFAGYRFGRMVGGPHVGFITAVLLLTDLSDFRLGGWVYTVEFGVWPQSLSLAFALLGLCHMPAIFESRRLSPIAAFAFWMGLSAITHPMIIIFLALLWPIAAAASAFSSAGHTVLGLLRLTLGCALTLPSGALWLLPFFSTKAYTNAMGVFWDTTFEMGRGLVSLTLFNGTLGYVLALGLPALIICARSRTFRLLFVAIVAVAVPMVTSSSWVDELHLTALHKAFAKVQYLRMATMVKPFWFALCGMMVVALVRAAPDLLRRMERSPAAVGAPRSIYTRAAFVTLFALVSLPLVVAAGEAFFVDHVRKSLRTVDDRPYLDDRTALASFLQENLPREGFYRLGIFMGHNHDLFDIAAELDVPMYKRGFTPCANYIYKMQGPESEVLSAVKLRYAISKQPPPQQDFSLIKRFGIYGLFAYKHYERAPYRILDGDGDIAVKRFEAERIELDAAAGSHGELQLPFSYFPRWHAYRDGQELPIQERTLAAEPEKTGFMTVPLAKGHYTFRFERTLLDRAALPLSLATWLLCLGVIIAERRRQAPLLNLAQGRVDHLVGAIGQRPRNVVLGAFALAVLGGFLALSQLRPALKPDAESGIPPVARVHYDFLEALDDARASIRYPDRRRSCKRVLGQLMCPSAEGDLSSARYVGSQPTTIEEYRMVRCIRARPETASVLSVEFPQVPRGQAIVGYYGMDYEGRLLFYKRPVDFRVSLDGAVRYEAQTERDNHMHWFRVDMPPGEGTVRVRFEVSAKNPYKRWFCFQAQVVDLAQADGE